MNIDHGDWTVYMNFIQLEFGCEKDSIFGEYDSASVDCLYIYLVHSNVFSELACRDEISWQYSPMSEDSDDSRFCDAQINTSSSQVQPDSAPSSPVSPYRYQKPLSGLYSAPSTSSHPPYGCALATITCSQPRQRSSDSEGRFPSSPSDICHSADLRRAALLRSVQMRAQPLGPSSFELPFSPGQEPVHNMDAEERPCSYMKSLVDEREEYQIECSSMGLSDPECSRDKSCRALNMDVKEDNEDDDSAD